jgi:hypothetical protein
MLRDTELKFLVYSAQLIVMDSNMLNNLFFHNNSNSNSNNHSSSSNMKK